MNSADSDPIYPFYLLDDRPVASDSFAADGQVGPHLRVSNAVCDLINSRADNVLRQTSTTIALEGTWGSGKSTVVRMIRKRLEKSENYLVVEFDAWAHEGDPLRRTFLETIAQQLEQRKWIAPDSLTGLQDRLSKRIRDINTTTVARPTPLGFYSSLAILFIPLGAALVTGALREKAEYWIYPDREISWQLIIGTILAVMPLLVGAWQLIAYLMIWTYWLRPKRRCEARPLFRSLFQMDKWPFFARQDSQHVHSQSKESTDPTSVEFEDEFHLAAR